MRKIAAIFIVLALIMSVAVACGNDGDDTTTQTIGTQYMPTSQITTEPTTTQADTPSYVLTTQAEKTVPWVSTTRFEITEAVDVTASTTGIFGTTSATASTDYNIYVNMEEITRPQVITSNATTAAKTTSAVNTTKSDSTTQPDSSKPVQLIVNSIAYGDGIIYVEVDPSNWSSGFVSKSQNIPVKVDGESAGEVSCKVPSSKTGDNYEIKINLSSIEVPAGATVEFTIPTAIVRSKAGNQHNLSYSSSVVVE